MNTSKRFKTFIVILLWCWLGLFAVVPNLLVLFSSFLSHNAEQLLTLPITLHNYHSLFQYIYFKVFLRSFWIASLTTILCLFISYPFAFIVARAKPHIRTLLLLLVMIPFWTSSLIRTYAIMILLKAKGLINGLLLYLGIIHQPLQLLYSAPAVLIGLVYSLLPFMILPLYASIEKLDDDLIEAARDLGANKRQVFWHIIIPQTLPGIIAGILLVFLPAMTLFYIPDILGGAKSMLLGNLIENQFLATINWPLGSATSIILLVIMLLLILIYLPIAKQRDQELA